MKRTELRRTGPPERRTPLRRGDKGLARTGPPARKTRLAPVSKKTRARNAIYYEAKAEHRDSNPWCEFPDPATGELCGRPGDDTHHVEGRGVAPDRVTDSSNFVTLCRPHHDDELALRAAGLIGTSSYELRLADRRRIEQGGDPDEQHPKPVPS